MLTIINALLSRLRNNNPHSDRLVHILTEMNSQSDDHLIHPCLTRNLPPLQKAFPYRLASEDPMTFVNEYCTRNNVVNEPGNTPIEKQCHIHAESAREQYKLLVRNEDVVVTKSSFQNRFAPYKSIRRSDARESLTNAQKYALRLRNNRKSAHASTVYKEVFRRELSAVLHSLSENQNLWNRRQCIEESEKSGEAAMKLEITRLRQELEQSKQDRKILACRLAQAEAIQKSSAEVKNVGAE